MNFFEFADKNPLLVFLAICLVCGYTFGGWNRFMRMLNIRKHGWPPPHCDADGDFKPEKDD